MIFETLNESNQRGELMLIEGGFCHWHLRKDGQITIREIISQRPGAGNEILERLKKVEGAQCIVAKCPTDLAANEWYIKRDFILATTEESKSGRKINVWKYNLIAQHYTQQQELIAEAAEVMTELQETPEPTKTPYNITTPLNQKERQEIIKNIRDHNNRSVEKMLKLGGPKERITTIQLEKATEYNNAFHAYQIHNGRKMSHITTIFISNYSTFWHSHCGYWTVKLSGNTTEKNWQENCQEQIYQTHKLNDPYFIETEWLLATTEQLMTELQETPEAIPNPINPAPYAHTCEICHEAAIDDPITYFSQNHWYCYQHASEALDHNIAHQKNMLNRQIPAPYASYSESTPTISPAPITLEFENAYHKINEIVKQIETISDKLYPTLDDAINELYDKATSIQHMLEFAAPTPCQN